MSISRNEKQKFRTIKNIDGILGFVYEAKKKNKLADHHHKMATYKEIEQVI